MATEESRESDDGHRREQPIGTSPDSTPRPAILLVDDDSFAIALQARMLRTMGYEHVFSATSGKAALQQLHDDPRRIDVIICDIKMPGMDGVEFLQIVNASAFRGSVILLSGLGVRIMHTVRKLLDNGRLAVLGALEKPTRRAPLQALLETWKPDSGADAVVRPIRTFGNADLPSARRESEWVLHYQPRVNLRTGALFGVEALLRWNHPEDGLLFPTDFIARAEETGVVDALTDWVLQQSMARHANFKAQGLDINLSVNVAIDCLRGPEFVRQISAFAQAAGLSAQSITLEISESRLLSTHDLPLENLIRLRLQGFGLALDDFGTGQSSLTQLRDVPFTELKVDRSFVKGARYNQIVRPILDGSIGICQRMGIQSVAEGVESEEDWYLLREIGCDIGQGSFIGNPMTPEELAPWLAHWQQRWPRLVGK